MVRISTGAHQYEARKGPQVSVSLLTFVDDGINVSINQERMQFVLNATSKLYFLLGLERNGGGALQPSSTPSGSVSCAPLNRNHHTSALG